VLLGKHAKNHAELLCGADDGGSTGMPHDYPFHDGGVLAATNFDKLRVTKKPAMASPGVSSLNCGDSLDLSGA